MPIFGVDNSMTNLPINQIKTMRAQGMENSNIIQALQREGFTISSIFDAMNQLDMPGTQPSLDISPPSNNFNSPPPSQGFTNNLSSSEFDSDLDSQSMFNSNSSSNSSSNSNYADDSYSNQRSSNHQHSHNQYANPNPSTEELIEAIIDEKWNDLSHNITKVIDWKNSANDRIVAMEQKINSLKDDFDKIHKALLGKIDRYEDNAGSVNASVLAMEKTFSKMLPLFAENIGELGRAVKELKDLKPKK